MRKIIFLKRVRNRCDKSHKAGRWRVEDREKHTEYRKLKKTIALFV